MIIRLLFLMLFALSYSAFADESEEVPICYNYNCAVIEVVEFDTAQMNKIQSRLATAVDAVTERTAIAEVIGLFETYTGMQTPTGGDKGGNLADNGVEGRMDCHDESANTTTYLRLLERKGWLKFHQVLEPVDRVQQLFQRHWAAHIVEKDSALEFVVDSWFFDNGHPAIVFTLEAWQNGAWPDDE